MKVIIKDDKVFASHKDDQDLTGLYVGMECLIVPDATKPEQVIDPETGIVERGSVMGLTKSELLALLSSDEMKEAEVKASALKRDDALAANEVTVSGNTFQTRPGDMGNFQLKLSELQAEETTRWKLKDNSVVVVSREDLETAYTIGIAQGNAIWDAHFDEIEA